jgi:hypothetical protein
MAEHCLVETCDVPCGPDALEFVFKGQHAGYICHSCLANIPALRVLFRRGSDKKLIAEEVTFVETPNYGRKV